MYAFSESCREKDTRQTDQTSRKTTASSLARRLQPMCRQQRISIRKKWQWSCRSCANGPKQSLRLPTSSAADSKVEGLRSIRQIMCAHMAILVWQEAACEDRLLDQRLVATEKGSHTGLLLGTSIDQSVHQRPICSYPKFNPLQLRRR